MESFTPLIIYLVIIIALFIVFRKVSWWYWGIDQFIRTQKKQELLLEQLVIEKSGALPLVKVKELTTGDVVEISIDGWVDLQIQYPNRYIRVF